MPGNLCASIAAVVDVDRSTGSWRLAQQYGWLAVRDPGAVRVVSDAAELVGTHLAAVCNLLAAAAGRR